MSIAGILANPASGKDIRRLVAHGSVFDNQEKVRMVRRLILGMERAGVSKIIYMPDAYAIVPRALNAISPSIPVEPVEMPIRSTEADTTTAAEIMATLGVGCLAVLGGDGTSRAACKGSVEIPVMPLSTGTNNVFPFMGRSHCGRTRCRPCCLRPPALGTMLLSFDACLIFLIDDAVADMALVDAAV